jgi:hypothetical protein
MRLRSSGYGLFGVNSAPASELSMSIPNVYLQSIADESYRWPKKLVIICEWACGYYSAIDCSTTEGEIVDLLDEPERKAEQRNQQQLYPDGWKEG